MDCHQWIIFSRCWMLDKYICLTRKFKRVFFVFFLMGNYKTPNGFASAGSILLYHPSSGLSNKVQMNCNVSSFLSGPWFPMRKEGEWHFKRVFWDLCFCIHGGLSRPWHFLITCGNSFCLPLNLFISWTVFSGKLKKGTVFN